VRFGLCIANFGTYGDPGNVVRIGEAAEAAGWEALLIWDHLSFVWGPPASDPWVALAAVAARTERLRLGTNLTPLPRRRPHVLAHQVATLDVLSGGRTVFAAGIGGVESEFTAFGEPADARLRASMLDEGLDLLRALWSGETVTHRGAHYTVEGVELQPRRVQERIPIWIGGNSPRALRRAARFDGWAADSESPEGMRLSPDDVAERVAAIREARGDGDFDVAVNGQVGSADPAAYAAAGAMWWLETLHDMRGSFDEMLALVAAGPPS
jgi:probable F420-dependent oxidoreductase